jgi:hypothetical protein
MTWERIHTQIGRGDTVTVSWRIPGGRGTPTLCVSISRSVTEKLGLVKGEKNRVIVERNKMAGKVRVGVAPKNTPRHECRHVAWKEGSCTIPVPLDDVNIKDKKPAQDVAWSIDTGWLVVKLPAWACPVIQVSGKAA